MKTLHLHLKKKWYDMIERGEKTEEYREIKPYWVARLAPCYKWCSLNLVNNIERCIKCSNNKNFNKISGMNYALVKFYNGYSKQTMTFEIKDIIVGNGLREWGCMDKEVFKIRLGNRMS